MRISDWSSYVCSSDLVASCRDTDPDLFFPVGTTGPAIEQIENAKAVCRECEAQAPCLEYALATNQDSGVWGGTSEEERRQLRKQYVARQRRTAYHSPTSSGPSHSAPPLDRQSVEWGKSGSVRGAL